MNITLTDITLELMHEYDRWFQYDPDIFMDMSRFPEWKYDMAITEARFQHYQLAVDRKYFFIMADNKPVGEICLKHIDMEKKQAELSIHLQNDTVKNQGIGTAAEKLLLAYAFDDIIELALRNKKAVSP